MTLQETLNPIKLYLFDMDGTLYLGDRLFPFTPALLQAIRARGASYLFVTNNSSKSVEDYVKKLEKLGISATGDDFLTSSQATAWYLQKHHRGARLYVGGTESLKDELRRAGFLVTDRVEETDCIVMGFDTELTFRKLHDISYLLQTRALPYIATNPDWVCPTEFGSVPDCGSVCEMLFRASGKRPVVIGKPQSLMVELAMEKRGVTRAQTCVIGDRIYTDIKSGLNAGVTTILVMSGETTEDILAASPDKPHFTLPSAANLLEALSCES